MTEAAMNVSEVMKEPAEVITPDTPIIEVSRKMRTVGVGILPVVVDSRLTGVITDRDIVLRVVAEGLDGEKTLAGDVMSHEVVCCFEDETEAHAHALMEKYELQRLPVIDRKHRLCGIVTLAKLEGHAPPHRTAVKVTFHKEKTDSHGMPHRVAVKTLYITGADSPQDAEAAAVRHIEQKERTAWTNVATGMETVKETDGIPKQQP
ncbi:MAG: CBS domain-containing protein [Rhodospirillales bacterium]|nr:CBS domain-containing protein [Rhodospirillales bacterium]